VAQLYPRSGKKDSVGGELKKLVMVSPKSDYEIFYCNNFNISDI
jgi:hypothetical protein